MEEEEEEEGVGDGGGGEGPLALLPPLRLFGEFADDADQRSVLVLQTLVIRPQVHQDLEVEGKKTKKRFKKQNK